MATSYTNIEQLLISESNRIGNDIYRKTVDTSPWLKLVKQDAWPDEMGTEVSVLVYERSLPYNANGALKVNWSSVGQNGGAYGGTLTYDGDKDILSAGGTTGNGNSTGSGDNAYSFPNSGGTIEFGQTLRTYGLQHAAMESPNISLNDLRFPMKRKEQLSNIMQIMTESTTEVWIQRYRDQYVDMAENKLLATSGTASTGEDTSIAGTVRKLVTAVDSRTTGFTVTSNAHGTITGGVGASVTPLTQAILDRVYMDLLRNGAGADAYDRVNGAPVFLAIMSPETSDSLIKANADIRQDFRWSERVSELLAPLGIQRSYRNFHHLVDAFAPRYNLVSGSPNTWARVYPFVRVANNSDTAKRQGYRYDLNPSYLTAGYEDTIIFIPDVFTSLVPKPLSVGDGMEFNAQNYRGEFTWRNIPDRGTNPDGTVGFFRAVYSNGAKPIFPHKGYVIRHARSTITS